MTVFQGSLLELVTPRTSTSAHANGRVRTKFWSPLRVRQAVNAVSNLGGSALVAVGVAMVHVPAGVITAGVLLVLNGFAATLPARQ